MLGDFIGELKGKITGQSVKCGCSQDGDKHFRKWQLKGSPSD